MPSTKKRISTCLSDEAFELIALRAKRDSKSLGKTISELVEIALEYEEDAHWNKICDELDAIPNKKYLTHEEFWERMV